MAKLKLEIELNYDSEMMHGKDADAIEWFIERCIKGDHLLLHCNDLGDTVGEVKVTGVGVIENE